MPMYSSRKFHTEYESLTYGSGSRNEFEFVCLIMPATDAKRPSDKIPTRDMRAWMLSCSFQIRGMGTSARIKSVVILTTVSQISVE